MKFNTVYKTFFKSFFDFIIATVVLVLLSPVLLVIAVMLALNNGGTPFFVQQRPGKHGKIFSIIKFKTMNNKKDVHGALLQDYHRLTFFGKMVRKTSIDELPQLINVVKGEMSLVGPRPLLPEYLPLYNAEQMKRHDVKPGITGWAQVNGRNALSWDEKFAYDVEYVDKISAAMDAKIILITMKKVIASHGVNANNYITMEAFKGNML